MKVSMIFKKIFVQLHFRGVAPPSTALVIYTTAKLKLNTRKKSPIEAGIFKIISCSLKIIYKPVWLKYDYCRH